MSRRNLVREFLDLDILEGIEFRGPRRHEQLALSVVGFAFPRALDKGTEFTPFDFLKDFGAAPVAGVGLDFDGGFYVRDAGDDAADRDEMAEFGAFDVSHGETGGFLLIRWGSQGFNVQVATLARC
jgi:hypothetical protein